MRFKEFLAERAVTKWEQDSVDIKKAIDLLNAHCKQGLAAIAKNGLLYRGFKHDDAVLVIDPSTGLRTSKDSNNLYQLMMDNSVALKDYPSRSKSLICTSSLNEALSYGTPFVVVPFDGMEIVCTDHDDFFGTDIDGPLVAGCDIENLNDQVAGIFYNSGYKQKNFQFTNIEALDKHVLKHAEEFEEEWVETFGVGVSDVIVGDKPFTNLCSQLMTPKNLSIFKQPYGEPLNRDVECWFSGKCVAIDARVFAGILEAMRESGSKIGNRINKEFIEHFHDHGKLDDMVVNYIKAKLK